MTQTPEMQNEMPKAYEAGKVEQKWYQFWLDKGYFTPKIDPKKKPFVIIMPPPNVTGELHVGHALTATLEDIMIRWHRMMGEPSLWLPGVDHAGIATQVVLERLLAKEGVDRHKIGKEEFMKRIKVWATDCRQTIARQHQRLGASCDWSRERFTLDEMPSRAVRHAFVRLYNKGLIYRGERIINWCPRCATALSDLEVTHKDLGGHLWYVKYPYEDKSGYITVATTRPETILGDTAVAVNPKDERYTGIIGKKVILPYVNHVIPVIGDDAVDPAFGTGAVKITPAHDPVDFDVAQRHNLPLVNILNLNATMNENAGPYQGLERFECRKQIVADLERDGQLVKIDPYSHSVGHCQRCGTIVEPIASKQWFVKTKPLAEPAIKAVTDGRIKIIPERFTKVYLNWMENIRDWCISRQLWWGHQIPVWYCDDCGALTAAVDEPKTCSKCGSAKIRQEPDVLDTWFSSALWPHSTLGWPEYTADFRYFYPTAVMETGYDILFFWVARMIMMGIEDTGEIPFKTVYLHGLIRDERGEKMSKVKGNVINPITTLETYGTDALRLTMITGTSPGNDTKLTADKLEASRNFANKLWNASRFVMRSFPPGEKLSLASPSMKDRPVEDRWILSRLNRTIESVNRLMGDFQFGEAQRYIHDFLWGDYCDWYIELAKLRLTAGQEPSPLPVLLYVLETALRLLHPYMPFITEELWQTVKKHIAFPLPESIMIAAYPEADAAAIDPEAEEVMEAVTEITRAIRNVRAQYRVEPARWITAQVYADALATAIMPYVEAIQNLARVKPLVLVDKRLAGAPGENNIVTVLKAAEVVIPMASMIDLAAEKQRIQKEIDGAQAELDRLNARLNSSEFLSKAPPQVVEKERQKLVTLTDKLARLKQQTLQS
ncbi:MAG: valine--tRNA ligase [Dehalococcoidales bacterium]|nr:valine--tRNA ligase [Dehalococcoidales bacterium]